MPALDMRLNPIRDTQFPSKEGVHKNKQTKGVTVASFLGWPESQVTSSSTDTNFTNFEHFLKLSN